MISLRRKQTSGSGMLSEKKAEKSLEQALWEGNGDNFARTLEHILQIIGDCQDLAETWNENCRTVFLTIYFGLLLQNPFQAESGRQLLGHPGD